MSKSVFLSSSFETSQVSCLRPDINHVDAQWTNSFKLSWRNSRRHFRLREPNSSTQNAILMPHTMCKLNVCENYRKHYHTYSTSCYWTYSKGEITGTVRKSFWGQASHLVPGDATSAHSSSRPSVPPYLERCQLTTEITQFHRLASN